MTLGRRRAPWERLEAERLTEAGEPPRSALQSSRRRVWSFQLAAAEEKNCRRAISLPRCHNEIYESLADLHIFLAAEHEFLF